MRAMSRTPYWRAAISWASSLVMESGLNSMPSCSSATLPALSLPPYLTAHSEVMRSMAAVSLMAGAPAGRVITPDRRVPLPNIRPVWCSVLMAMPSASRCNEIGDTPV